MGLLGRFKGKLIGTKAKTDKTKDTIIVCTKFRRFSEFDTPSSDSPSSSFTNISNAVANRAPNSSFTTVGTNPEAEQSVSNSDYPIEKTGDSNGHVWETVKRKAQAPPAPVDDNSNFKIQTPLPNRHSDDTSNTNRNLTLPRENKNEDFVHYDDDPDDDSESCEEVKSVNDDWSPQNYSRQAASLFFDEDQTERHSPPPEDNEDDDGNFRIHVTDRHRNEEVESINDGWSPKNYSSQAASIFFGEDEEPVLTRPRNVVFDDDDGNSSDNSSASA